LRFAFLQFSRLRHSDSGFGNQSLHALLPEAEPGGVGIALWLYAADLEWSALYAMGFADAYVLAAPCAAPGHALCGAVILCLNGDA
jgi:hypothetical protein